MTNINPLASKLNFINEMHQYIENDLEIFMIENVDKYKRYSRYCHSCGLDVPISNMRKLGGKIQKNCTKCNNACIRKNSKYAILERSEIEKIIKQASYDFGKSKIKPVSGIVFDVPDTIQGVKVIKKKLSDACKKTAIEFMLQSLKNRLENISADNIKDINSLDVLSRAFDQFMHNENVNQVYESDASLWNTVRECKHIIKKQDSKKIESDSEISDHDDLIYNNPIKKWVEYIPHSKADNPITNPKNRFIYPGVYKIDRTGEKLKCGISKFVGYIMMDGKEPVIFKPISYISKIPIIKEDPEGRYKIRSHYIGPIREKYNPKIFKSYGGLNANYKHIENSDECSYNYRWMYVGPKNNFEPKVKIEQETLINDFDDYTD